MMNNVAIIVTCHDRREKTLKMLGTLSEALDYSLSHGCEISGTLFLTDDGCSDGTAEAVSQWFDERRGEALKNLHILKGNGSLFWAGGMRKAWQLALKVAALSDMKWDFFLLVNDDTLFYPDAMQTLLECHQTVSEQTGHEGIYSGIIADEKEGQVIYGGNHIDSQLLYTYHLITPNGHPQPADEVHANSLLVSAEAAERVGIFSDGYQHGYADFDYARKTLEAGLPVYVTGKAVGEGTFDHPDDEKKKNMLLGMTLAQRKAWFAHPLHSNADDLLYKRRYFPMRYPLCWMGRMLNVYVPQLYYFMSDLRRKVG